MSLFLKKRIRTLKLFRRSHLQLLWIASIDTITLLLATPTKTSEVGLA